MKLHQRKFRLDFRKRFFTDRFFTLGSDHDTKLVKSSRSVWTTLLIL